MLQQNDSPHVSVLLEESVSKLITNRNGIYIDGTLGYGGHAQSILERLGSKGLLIGMELNPESLSFTKNRLSHFKGRFSPNLINYKNFTKVLLKHNISKINGFFLDLGLSSPIVDHAKFGFSYKIEGPLNMLFSQSNQNNAKDFLNSSKEAEIYKVLRVYGEEPNSKKISKSIVLQARKHKMNSTFDLRNAVCSVTPVKFQRKTLSRVFQAIRIKVNNELEILKNTLELTLYFLKKGGRIVVISYHSLEDKIVKAFFKKHSTICICPIEIPICVCNNVPSLKKITTKAIIPTSKEIKINKRSRSARLRVSERI